MINSFIDIDTSTDEGKMLFGAVALLTSVVYPDKTPDQMIKEIQTIVLRTFGGEN